MRPLLASYPSPHQSNTSYEGGWNRYMKYPVPAALGGSYFSTHIQPPNTNALQGSILLRHGNECFVDYPYVNILGRPPEDTQDLTTHTAPQSALITRHALINRHPTRDTNTLRVMAADMRRRRRRWVWQATSACRDALHHRKTVTNRGAQVQEEQRRTTSISNEKRLADVQSQTKEYLQRRRQSGNRMATHGTHHHPQPERQEVCHPHSGLCGG